MADDEDDEGEGGGGAGFDVEALRSYLAYVKRALRQHWLVVAVVGVIGLAFTVTLVKYFPRTYSCTTVLMAQASRTLEGNPQSNLLDGAMGLIMRHDNLEEITENLDLIDKFHQQRSPLLRAKDRLSEKLGGGKPTHQQEVAAIVGTLETKITITMEQNFLTIVVDWNDGATAAAIAAAARESFVKARHGSEISAFEDKLAILDEHAKKTREEVDQLANQIRAIYGDRIAARAAASASAAARAPAVPRMIALAGPSSSDTGASAAELKQQLDQKKAHLADLENDHARRLLDEESKLADLKLRLGPMHPDVVVEEQKVALARQDSDEILRLRSEVQALDADARPGADGAPRRLSTVPRTITAARESVPDTLPPDIWRILEQEDIDPSVGAQLRGAVLQYAQLRDAIRTGQIELDTAQAAFNYRYRVVIPADPPSKPSKPKVIVLLLGGVVGSLLFAILIPVLLELKNGVVVARWQVQMIALPILAELRLPPLSEPPKQDRDTGPAP
ncbi:MAG TPA: hypothetical protein VMI54_08695 [Polyangiaceae bacterium]|nr:hypothetical protein [Polyangiaceae bacterium]